MQKGLFRSQAVGFLFTGAAGALLHFVYEWSGESPLAAPFSGVNESTWEHMKLLFFPMFLFALAQASLSSARRRNYWTVKLAGTLTGLGLIPVIYYTYTGVSGASADWLNISIFYLAAFAAYWAEFRLFNRSDRGGGWQQMAAIAALWLLAVAFVVLTWFPPHIPLFQDPATGLYGLAK